MIFSFKTIMYQFMCVYAILISLTSAIPQKHFAHENESCSGDVICHDGLYCIDSICHRIAQLGEKCSTEIVCADGLRCCDMTKMCRKMSYKDEACQRDDDCFTGMMCDSGSCQPSSM